MPFSPGERLGPYEIVSLIGSGGMGEVWKACDMRLGRDVAIKVLAPARAKDPDALMRFEQEARSASALNHPNIVTIYDIGRLLSGGDSIPYIAMEFVEGHSLRQVVSQGPPPIQQLLDIAIQAAEALAAAHAKGIVHRDLKPENIMISGDAAGHPGLVKILDFGLAKLATTGPAGASDLTAATLTQAGLIMGTVGYMSPEQARGQGSDFRSDQFSLGVILYEMASGRRAFRRPTAVETLAAIIRDEPEAIDQVNPQIPPPLQWAIKRCLAKSPEDRYGSTRELARDLAIVRDHLGDGSGETRTAPQHNLPPQRTPLIGRETVLSAARQLMLRRDVRLVTLTGPGGTGKTRLALQLAEDLLPDFEGGIYFGPLAAITDSALVAPTIAQALGVRAAGNRPPIADLKEHLKHSHRDPFAVGQLRASD
jgi:eukaryotic-like serine/threonine-protein kinase